MNNLNDFLAILVLTQKKNLNNCPVCKVCFVSKIRLNNNFATECLMQFFATLTVKTRELAWLPTFRFL